MNMRSVTFNLVFLLFIVISGGCSSVVVHTKVDATPSPYSGTNIALTKTKKLWYKYDLYGAIVLSVFDVPFSFLADTILYPIDIYRKNNYVEISK